LAVGKEKRTMKGIAMKSLLTALWGLLLFSGYASAQLVEYYHLDALGSVRAVTDDNGDVITRHDYLPYGEEWNAEPSSDTRRFTGKERDEENGLDYFGARYYGTGIGIFTSVDPAMTMDANLVDPQRWNRYAYARGNPQFYVDPDGRLLDTIVDVASIAYDVFDIGSTIVRGEQVTKMQAAALVADVVSAVIPVATGGGIGVRAAGKADDVVDAVKGVDDVADAARGGSRAPDFVVSPGGTAYPVPRGATGPVSVVNNAGNRTGTAFTGGRGGANGQVDTIRLMDPTPPRGGSPGYPSGYIKYENAAGQGVNPYTGRTGSRADTHFPLDPNR
jgi:RHS repeat-associated protein